MCTNVRKSKGKNLNRLIDQLNTGHGEGVRKGEEITESSTSLARAFG